VRKTYLKQLWNSDRFFFWATLAVFTTIHVVLAGALPISGDEAYYWSCARNLDWSYFDQPPLMIWPIAVFRLLVGDTNLAVRGSALLASFLLALFLRGLIRRHGGSDRQAAAAYLLLHATPLFFLGSFYGSTDIGLASAYIAATWAAVAIGQGERRAWWGFGIATGLGFLAKFPIVFVLPTLIPVLMRREARRHLRSPIPWAAALLSLALTTPVWLWAMRYDWVNILFQLRGRHDGEWMALGGLFEFMAANLLLATPFLVVAFAISLWLHFRAEAQITVTTVAAITPVAVFMISALFTQTGPHWSGPAFVPAVAILALTPFRGRRWLIALGFVTGVSVSLLVVGVVSVPKAALDLEWSYRGRPQRISTKQLKRLIGNEEITQEIENRLLPGEFLLVPSYSKAHLYEYLSDGRLRPRLIHITGGKHGLASLYWYERNDLIGVDGLVPTEGDNAVRALPDYCSEVVEEEPYFVLHDSDVIRHVRFFRCRGIMKDDGALTRK
jgi:hypothetical protein